MTFVGPIKLLILSTALSLGSLLAATPAFASPQRLAIANTPQPKPGPAPSISISADGGPAHVYVTGYGFQANETFTLTVLTPNLTNDLGRETKLHADENGNFRFLFHSTGLNPQIPVLPNLASYSGPVVVAADAASLAQVGTLWSQTTTIDPPPVIYGPDTYQAGCGAPVNTMAYGFTPGDSVQFSLYVPPRNGYHFLQLLDGTTTTADLNLGNAYASLQTHGYSGVAWVVANEMGNPNGFYPLAPDAEIWYQMNVC